MAKITYIGIPSSAQGIAATISNYVTSLILVGISISASAAFAAYTRVQGIMLLPLHGIHSGLITMTAFFYGQKNLRRMKRTLVSGMAFMVLWNTVFMVVTILFPASLLSIFHAGEEMLHYGIYAFRVIGSTYVISAAALALMTFLQAIGKSYLTIFFSLSRQLLVRIPLIVILSRLPDKNAIWWSYVVSEVFSDTILLFIFRREMKELKDQLSL